MLPAVARDRSTKLGRNHFERLGGTKCCSTNGWSWVGLILGLGRVYFGALAHPVCTCAQVDNVDLIDIFFSFKMAGPAHKSTILTFPFSRSLCFYQVLSDAKSFIAGAVLLHNLSGSLFRR